jgi:NADPH:quinone reductase-like Zn-dependent oxidoreductase
VVRLQIAKSFGAAYSRGQHGENGHGALLLQTMSLITKEDFTKLRYDLILAANGDRSISDYRRALSPKGIYVQTGGSMAQTFQAMLLGPIISMTGSKTMGNMLVKPNQKDLVFMKGLIEAGKVMPVIDRCYPLSEVLMLRILKKGMPGKSRHQRGTKRQT